MPSYVYILASQRKGTLYTGVTSNLIQRTSEHKLGIKSKFAGEYSVKLLVYYEVYENVLDAIAREKILKKWRRDWKIALIEKDNPWWHDLFRDIAGGGWRRHDLGFRVRACGAPRNDAVFEIEYRK